MFLFSGDEAEKPVAGLSGGERQRFSLAVLVNSGANMLVLDEPTNHLDLESREALEDALRGFPGSLLLVSHDRALLDAVGSRTVAIEDGELNTYEGGWAEYVERRDAALEAAAPAPKPKSKAKPAAKKANGPGPSKNAQRDQPSSGAPDRGGRGRPGRPRGRAGRPLRLERPARLRQVPEAPRGRQAPRRRAVRTTGRRGRLKRLLSACVASARTPTAALGADAGLHVLQPPLRRLGAAAPR